MEENYFRVQSTDRFLRFKIGRFNIYFAIRPLSVRKSVERGLRKKRRRELKERLIDEKGHCEICGCPLTFEEASVHHIKPVHAHPELQFEYDNLMLLCVPCHVQLHSLDALRMRAEKMIIN